MESQKTGTALAGAWEEGIFHLPKLKHRSRIEEKACPLHVAAHTSHAHQATLTFTYSAGKAGLQALCDYELSYLGHAMRVRRHSPSAFPALWKGESLPAKLQQHTAGPRAHAWHGDRPSQKYASVFCGSEVRRLWKSHPPLQHLQHCLQAWHPSMAFLGGRRLTMGNMAICALSPQGGWRKVEGSCSLLPSLPVLFSSVSSLPFLFSSPLPLPLHAFTLHSYIIIHSLFPSSPLHTIGAA